MLLPGRALLLLPPGCRVCPAARQQTLPIGRSVAGAVPNRLHRGAVLLQAKKRATDSEDPTPAPASSKGRKKKTEVEAAEAATAAEAEAAAAEAEAAASEDAALANWVDSGGSPEEDRRRFPFHRRLQAAASDGNIEAAESAFGGMEAAGLAPGPRAFHVLLCAHLKGADTPGALGVTGRATEAGVQLLPESYAVLIYAAMESVTPPDLEVAKALYSALSSTGTDRQLPWATLARLLAGKGFGAEAVAAVREGLREGLVLDADVAAAYLKGLCDTGQLPVSMRCCLPLWLTWRMMMRREHSHSGTGGLRLLDGGALSALLQLLSAQDMPVDMLQLLVYMAEDGCRMPAGALVPDGGGVTPLDGWLSGHLEGMAARADMRTAEADMLKAPIEYVNGVPLGPGLCVVDEGGSIVPVAKATVKELRAEAEARQIVGAKDMKRPELAAAIKAARARLPFNVLQAQVSTAGEGVKGGSKRKAVAGGGGARKAKRKGPAREVWVINPEGELDIVDAPPDSAFMTESEKFLLSESALDELDLTDDQYALSSNKNNKEIDFDALLEARMLDEGTAAVMNVGDEDVVSGFATLLPGAEGDDERPDADDEDDSKGGAELDEEAWRKMQSFEARSIDPQTLQEGYRQLQFLEAQQIDTDEANLVAGMDIAMDILRAAETVGGGASPADLLLLTSGALAERNVNAAADIARRLSLLLSPEAAAAATAATSSSTAQQPEWYDPAFVLQQYESLAEMCLSQRAVQQADVVLESAEVAGLQPSPAVLAKLTAALRGQPRRGERLGRENAALLERAGVDDLGDLGLTNTDTLQQQQQLAAGSTSAAAAAAAAGGGQPPTEVTVEALSVRDTPVQQQQQQQQQEEDEELPSELQDMAAALQGVADWEERQQEMGEALSKLGLDDAAISDVLAQPAALMADSSWVTAALLSILQQPDEDELLEGQQQQQGRAAARAAKSIDDMSLAELAKACATDRLTPEQSDALVGLFEEAGLPLLYDEVQRRILWPGSSEYEDWAGDNPAEAAEDQECVNAAFAEEFAPELQQAGEAAEAVSAALEAEGGLSALEARLAAAAAGGGGQPEVQQFLSLKQEFHEALQEMGLMPSSEQQEGEAGAAGEESTALAFEGSSEEREQLIQELQQQLELLIDERQDELRAAYKQMGLGEPDLNLGNSSGCGGDDDGSGSGSSRRKQLTGR